MGAGLRVVKHNLPTGSHGSKENYRVATAPRLTAHANRACYLFVVERLPASHRAGCVQDGLGRRVERGAESEGNCEALAVPDIWCLDDGCQVSPLSGPQRLR